jgi:hypothetical protein
MENVKQEIEALHEFFVGWFSGKLPKSDFNTGFASRFADGFLLIPPAGIVLDLDSLKAGIHEGYGSNPDFRIAIRNVNIRRQTDDYILATYEEWQRNAIESSPPDNARVATVLFTNTEVLKWLHVHETDMPEDQVRSGNFDF